MNGGRKQARTMTHGKRLVVLGKTLELSRRAGWATQTLDAVVSLTATLLADENFLTLLRAESLLLMPTVLANRVSSLRRHGN